MKKLAIRFLKLAMLSIMVLATSQVFAYKMVSPNAKCNLSTEQRKDPDLVIRDYLEIGHLYCGNRPHVENKNYYKNFEKMPIKGIASLLEKYEQSPEVTEAYYKDYKILDRRQGGLVDGRPTLIYRTEILYVLVTASYINPVSRPLEKGEDYHADIDYFRQQMAICEKIMVDIVIGDTSWGWYKLPNPSIGTNMSAYFKSNEDFKKSDNYKNFQHARVEQKNEVERYTRLANQCKLKL